LTLRVNATCSHVFAFSTAAADGAESSSAVNPAGIARCGSGFQSGLGMRADDAAIITARTQMIRLFFMTARTGLFLQSIDLRLGDLAAFASMLKPVT